MSANVIQEYLVSLGFAINNTTFNQFNQTMNQAQKTVEAATAGMSRAFVSASATMVTAIGTVTIATGGMLHSLAKADMEYQKFALRMWMTKQNAKELKTTLDALGESLEDAAFIPELRGQFQSLLNQGRQMAVPGDEYAQQMRDIRSIGFEFKRMKLEATHAMEWVGYYLMKYLAGPLATAKKWLKDFNDTISKSMPVWTEKIAYVLSRVVNLFIAVGRLVKNVYNALEELWGSIPKGVQTALMAFAVLGAALINGPFGMALLTVGALLLLLEDFFGFLDGKESSTTMKPFWTWLVKTWGEFKEELEKLKVTLNEIWDKFKESETMKKFMKTWGEFKKMLTELRIELGLLLDKVKDFFGEIDKEKTKGAVGFLLEYWLGVLDKILTVLTFIGRLWIHIFRGDAAQFLKDTLTDIQNWANGKKPGDAGYHPKSNGGGYRGGHPSSPENWNDAYGEKPKNLTGSTQGLDKGFLAKLSRLAQSRGVTLNIDDGFRTYAEQQELWNKSDMTGKWVAAPGTSRHEAGYAIDAEWAKSMTDEELAAFGLYRPMPYEPWHVEPIETRGKSTAELMEQRRAGGGLAAWNSNPSIGGFAPTGAAGGVTVATVNNISVSVPSGVDANGLAAAIAKALEPYQGMAQVRVVHQMREMQGVQA